MKKFFAMGIAIAAMTLCMTGCGSNEAKVTSPEIQPTTIEVEVEEEEMTINPELVSSEYLEELAYNSQTNNW